MEINKLLSQQEQKIYQLILEEIANNPEFYLTAQANEKLKALLNNCQVKEKDLYQVIKKITNITKSNF